MSNTDLMELREHLARRKEQAREFAKESPAFARFYEVAAEKFDRWGRALDEVTS